MNDMMLKKKRYKLIAVFGPSCSGKHALVDKVCAVLGDKIHRVVSYTTRPPRVGEASGIDYYFINHEDFVTDEFIEKNVFDGEFYGTGLEELDKDKINIGIFSAKSIPQLLNRDDIIVTPIYIRCAGRVRLNRALVRSNIDHIDCTEVCRRYLTDEDQYRGLDFPYYVCSDGKHVLGLIHSNFQIDF